MSVDAHKPGPPASKEALAAGHEISEVESKPIVAFLVLLLVFSAFCFGIIVIYFKFLAADAARLSPRPSPLITNGSTRVPPEPRLQVDAWGDWDTYKLAQDRALSQYSWVDRDSQIVRIPVEAAMEKILAHGLPHREGVMTPPGAPDAMDTHGAGEETGGRMAPPGGYQLKPPPSAVEPAPSAGSGGHH